MKGFLCFAFLAVVAVAWAIPAPAPEESRDKRGLLLADYGWPGYGYGARVVPAVGYFGRSYGYGLPAYGYNYGLNNGYGYSWW